MKKTMLLVLLCILTISLSSCRSWRENLLAPPDEMEIPDGSTLATCIVDDIEYKYVFQNDGVYQYFIDDVEQEEESLHLIQEQAFLHNESVRNYLAREYGAFGCSYEDYVSPNVE